jgi:transposase
MDMWDPCATSTLNHLPDAQSKIVFDKFHIAKHLSEAVDQVRRRENTLLRAQGDDRLAGTRYDWLRHPARHEVRGSHSGLRVLHWHSRPEKRIAYKHLRKLPIFEGDIGSAGDQ